MCKNDGWAKIENQLQPPAELANLGSPLTPRETIEERLKEKTGYDRNSRWAIFVEQKAS